MYALMNLTLHWLFRCHVPSFLLLSPRFSWLHIQESSGSSHKQNKKKKKKKRVKIRQRKGVNLHEYFALVFF